MCLAQGPQRNGFTHCAPRPPPPPPPPKKYNKLCFTHLGQMDVPTLIFLSLYTARPSFEYYRQVYFVHSGLPDESLQVTISKLP